MDIKTTVIELVCGLLLVNVLLYGRPWSAPNLGHPVRWRRWLNRALAYPCCHFLSFAVVLLILDGLSDYFPALHVSNLARSSWSGAVELLLPVPGALLLMKLGIWSQRALFGYEHWPPPVPEAPMPPAWVPPPPRRNDFSGLDLHDPELVRELARSHWRVVREAVEQGTSMDDAEALHRSFLHDYLGTVERALAQRVTRIYAEEMAAQAQAAQVNAARIAALRDHQMAVLNGEVDVRR